MKRGNSLREKPNLPSVTCFPECQILDTRGRESFPSVEKCMTLGEARHSGKRGNRKKLPFDGGMKRHCMEEIFPECHTLALGEACLFPECLTMALGEGSLPRVLGQGTRELLFFFKFFCPIFCEAFPHYLKLLAQIWGNFKFFRYISLVFVSLNFFHTSNLNYRCMKSYNLVIQKMIFMIFGVYWGCIYELKWNVEHLFVVTWRTTYGKSVSKLQKIRTKSENHENCLGVMLSHVKVVCKNWEDFEQVVTPNS
jgi:hypothetical protein